MSIGELMEPGWLCEWELIRQVNQDLSAVYVAQSGVVTLRKVAP